MNIEPTKREVIYPSFVCNAKCRFCYEKHSGRWGRQRDYNTIISEINSAKNNGCNYIDFSGGEPTIYTKIIDLIKYIKSISMNSCIITNGLCGQERAIEIINSGLDDFLISVHGLENSHNSMVGIQNAWNKQQDFIKTVSSLIKFRFNCVINGMNYKELPELAEYFSSTNCKIVNFINFNPHNNWGNHPEEINDFIADLRLVEPQLNKAIKILESNNIGVNVRYYPMCRIAEEYRRCVCNDLHVHFDPYEWTYGVTPKEYLTSLSWAKGVSNNIEEKGKPCCDCDLQNICGGINKVLNKLTNNSSVDIIKNFSGDKNDFYFYRKNNVLTLN